MRGFFLYLLLFLISCKASQTTQCDSPTSDDCPTKSETPVNSVGGGPSTSGKVLFVSSATSSTITLKWDAAVDNETPQGQLFYSAYVSTPNPAFGAFDEVSEVEKGSLIASGSGMSSADFNISTVALGTTFQFNVVVIDQSGNKAVYRPRGELIDQGLLYYWTFDGHTNDISTSGNHLVYFDGTGSFLYESDRYAAPNSAGNMQVTDTSTRSATLQSSMLINNASLSSNAARSFSVWARPRLFPLNGNVPNQILFLYGSSGTDAGFGFRFGTATYFMTGNAFFPVDATVTPEWTHWVLSYNGSTINFYRNGVLYNATTMTLVTPSATNLTVGRAANSFASNLTEFFDGQIDDLVIYGRALSSTEVENLYQVQRAQ